MNTPRSQTSRSRAKAYDGSGYRPGAYKPDIDPLHGLTDTKIQRLRDLARARDVLDPHNTRRLLTEGGTCRQIGTHLWYPSGRSYLKSLRTICRNCPLWRPCLLYALATNQTRGMWAGTTAQQRQRLNIRLRAAAHTGPSEQKGVDHDG